MFGKLSGVPWFRLTYDLRYWIRHLVPLYPLILEWYLLRILLKSLKVFLAAAALSRFFKTGFRTVLMSTVMFTRNLPCLISSVLESPKLAVNIWIGVISVAVQVDPFKINENILTRYYWLVGILYIPYIMYYKQHIHDMIKIASMSIRRKFNGWWRVEVFDLKSSVIELQRLKENDQDSNHHNRKLSHIVVDCWQ